MKMNLNLLNKIIFGGLLINSISGAIDCKNFVKDGFKFNLEKIATIVKEVDIPTYPTTNTIAFHINLCEPLTFDDKIAKEDRCSDKAFGCKIVTNFKDEKPRVIRVIEMAKSTASQSEAKWEVNKSDKEFESIYWTMDNQEDGDKKFKVKLTLSCSEKEKIEPIINTDPNDNKSLELTISNKFICPTKDDSDPKPEDPNPKPEDPEPPKDKKPDDSNKSSGSGFTTFLIIIFVLLGFYFIGGCIYNYHFYDARGLNLVPHLSFWKEVPEMTMQLIRRGVLLISGRRRGRYTRV